MTILALDTASRKSGYAIYTDGTIITSGSFSLREKGETPTERTQSREIALYDKVCDLISKHNVTQVVAEDIFKSDNPELHSAWEVLGTCRGVIISATHASELPPVQFITPVRAKHEMWGYSSSRQTHREMERDTQKALMCRAVERLGYTLNRDRNGNPDNDQADALGILITYLKLHNIPVTHPNAQ